MNEISRDKPDNEPAKEPANAHVEIKDNNKKEEDIIKRRYRDSDGSQNKEKHKKARSCNQELGSKKGSKNNDNDHKDQEEKIKLWQDVMQIFWKNGVRRRPGNKEEYKRIAKATIKSLESKERK